MKAKFTEFGSRANGARGRIVRRAATVAVAVAGTIGLLLATGTNAMGN